MIRWLSSQPGFSSAHRRILQNQAIDQNGPGTILQDFETLLAFLRERDLPVSKSLQVLPLRVLPEINSGTLHPGQTRRCARAVSKRG